MDKRYKGEQAPPSPRDYSCRPFVLGITGPSGSGKSTLASALADRMNKTKENIHKQQTDEQKQQQQQRRRRQQQVAKVVVFPEDPTFFKERAAASYKDRDPASETPLHVDWDAYWSALEKKLLLLSSSSSLSSEAKNLGNDRTTKDTESSSSDDSCPQTKQVVVVLVEHYLLLHDTRVVSALDGMIFLDPTTLSSTALTASCNDDNDKKEHDNNKNDNDDCKESTRSVSDTDAMWTCLERRVLRNPNRTATETLYMCRYYQDHVWPNYKKWTYYKAKDMCETRGKTFVRVDCRQNATEIVDYVKDSIVAWIG